MDQFRHHVLLAVMPVFFLSHRACARSGTSAALAVFVAAALLLVASVGGKLVGRSRSPAGS